jgi:hypothetical protein
VGEGTLVQNNFIPFQKSKTLVVAEPLETTTMSNTIGLEDIAMAMENF